jgi:phosphoglycerate dehydrogenase-like enzyme
MAMKAVLPGYLRGLFEARLPGDIEAAWAPGPQEALAQIEGAQVAWLDFADIDRNAAVRRAPSLKWLFTVAAGLDGIDCGLFAQRGVTITNGLGLTTSAVAEYAVLGVLAAAKRYDRVVRLTDRREWPEEAPGRMELEGSRALIVGFGHIGRAIGRRLAGFGVQVTGVNRTGRDGALTPHAWRGRLAEFDWVLLAAPVTGATRAMIGAAELAAMKPTAWLVNVGRGDLVDQDALIEALRGGRIGGAFLDVVTPEPLPAEHPLWGVENALLSMHLSGRSQKSLWIRAADLFLENLDAFRAGRPMRNVVDLQAGY